MPRIPRTRNKAPKSPPARRRVVRHHGITGIDHALVGVRNLEKAAATWRRLGFTLTPRGRHVGWGTANYCVVFLHAYVELLGIVDPAQFTNNLDRLLKAREGLLGVAFGAGDAGRTAASLARAGLKLDAPKDLARLLEVSEDDVMLRFRLVMLPPAATPGLSAFVCQHLTPDLVRWPAWLEHPNGAVSLKSLTAVVDDPRALIGAYERLLGAGSLIVGDGTLTVRAGRTALVFTTPRGLAGLHPGVKPLAVKPPYLAAMTLGVVKPAATAQYLDDYGIKVSAGRDGVVRVDPLFASGVILAFAAA